MACTTITLADIDYSCDDLGIGGIVELHLSTRTNALAAIGAGNYDEDTRVISAGNPSAGVSGIVHLSFNLKDGFSVFSEVKTVNADGTTTTVPTISVELPKMDADKTTKLNQIAKGGAELVAWVKTAAGTFHVSGLDYGLYASTVDANSGTGRAEKNRFQLTLTGEENGLSYSIGEADFNTATA
jgi:hypothetical protein